MLLGVLGERVELGARQLANAGVDALDDPAALQRVGEHLEVASSQLVTQVAQLEPEAGIGSVGAEAMHRLGVRHPRPWCWRDIEPRLLEDGTHHRFGRLDHVVLLDEPHLDVELRELLHPVGPGVLVAEAADDLVVALEAADHQQLLEQLGRLWQGVERAGLRASGDEEVAGSLRCRAGQERRLDVEELARIQYLAHGHRDPVAELERLAQRRPAQVQ